MPDEPDDEGARGVPPDPLDRVWFHPSELGFPDVAMTPPPGRTRPWGIGLLGALCGVAATLGVLGATGAIGGDTAADLGATGAPVWAGLHRDHTAQLVAAAAPSVVGVEADGVPDGAGSGVAFGGDRVVTSAALVTGATAVRITTSRGRVLVATVAGSDAETDLALLRTEDAHLPAAHLGSADGLEVGTWVLAVGSPGGARRWASQGVVSALREVVPGGDGAAMPGMLATDVDATATSGGGPLLDTEGSVVAILSRAAPGHAVPVDVAREVAEQLGASGRVHHAWLGVDAVDARGRSGGGAAVDGVVAGGPAEHAGLQSGDVITTLGDDRVNDEADLLAAVAHRRPGDPVELTVWRAGRRLERPVTLGERP